MKAALALFAPSVAPKRKWFHLVWKSTLWIVLLSWIAYYVRRDAFHYLFRYTPESFKAFWSERIVIRTHIAAAIVMPSSGALQFWTGLGLHNMTLHRWCGCVFLVSGTCLGAPSLVIWMRRSRPRFGSTSDRCEVYAGVQW